MAARRFDIEVSAGDCHWAWQGERMWTGSATVAVESDDGRIVRYSCHFGGNPFRTREEAEAFARRKAIERVLGAPPAVS